MSRKQVIRRLSGIVYLTLFTLSCTSGEQEQTSGSIQQTTPEQDLFNALISRDLAQVKAIIKGGVDVNVRVWSGETPLHIAAVGAVGVVLLDKPSAEVLEYLIAQGADLEAKDAYCGATPLYRAVLNGQKAAAEFLIAKGADVNAKDDDGLTPLDAATGRQEIMKLLMANGATVDNLPAAAFLGDLAKVKLLLEEGRSVNPKFKNVRMKSPLMLAAGEGHIEIVELVLSQGATLQAEWVYGETALHFAARNGHMEMVKLLIAKGADVNFKSGDMQLTPLAAAVGTGRIEMLELLISKGADVNFQNGNNLSSPLHRAVAGRHPQELELLIKNGADLEARISFGHRPLHLAAIFGQLEAAIILLMNGAQINAKNDSGNTPLAVALLNGHEDVAALLRKHGGREKDYAGKKSNK